MNAESCLKDQNLKASYPGFPPPPFMKHSPLQAELLKLVPNFASLALVDVPLQSLCVRNPGEQLLATSVLCALAARFKFKFQ